MHKHVYVTVTKTKGYVDHILPRRVTFTIRGHRKGKNAKPCKCIACHGEIAVGEQYIRLNELPYCLGCVEYE